MHKFISQEVYRPDMRGSSGRGVVQCVHNATNDNYLWGSLNGTDWALIGSFGAVMIRDTTLAPYMKIGGSATVHGTGTTGSTFTMLDETRGG